MDIHFLAPIIAPLATAVSVLAPLMASAWGTKRRLDTIERTLQLLILHDEHLPDRERLNAGKRYIDLGGNGASKVYYDELEARYRKRVGHKIQEEEP